MAVAASSRVESAAPAGVLDRWSLAWFLAALGPRLYVALAWTREPVWDGHYYDFGARRIAAGLGYSDDVVVGGLSVWHPWCHYPVGYSGLLAFGYRLFGDGPYVGPVMNALLGAALAVVVYGLGRAILGPTRSHLAAALVALHPGLVAYSALLMTEVTAALGIALAGLVAARGRGRWPATLLAAAMLGATTLVRPQSILLAPAIGLFAWQGSDVRQRLRRAGARAAVATAVALAVVSPWTVRNCRVMDGCAFVSTNVGWNLAIGAFPRATGRFETLRASDGCRVVTGQVSQDRCWLRAGLDWIAEDPGRWLALVPRKLGLTFDHESFPVGYLAEADPDGWPPVLRERVREGLTLFHRALLVAAALGLVAWPFGRRVRWGELALLAMVVGLTGLAVSDPSHPFWPLALLVALLGLLPGRRGPTIGPTLAYVGYAMATVLVTHAVFFGEDRYHVVVSPLLCLLAAAALRPPAARADAAELSRPRSASP